MRDGISSPANLPSDDVGPAVEDPAYWLKFLRVLLTPVKVYDRVIPLAGFVCSRPTVLTSPP